MLDGIGKGISDIFINMSSEYPALLDGILILFAAMGIIIAATAVLDITKIGSGGSQMGDSRAGAITGKLIGGVGLVDLSLWARVWSSTLWANSDPLGISAYAPTSSGGDYAEKAIMAALGVMVIAGYVTLGRAYLGITKLGYMTPESRSNMIGNIFSRILAGSALISCLHVARAINNSAGINIIPI